MKRVYLSGGFHNSSSTFVLVSEKDFNRIKGAWYNKEAIYLMDDALTDSQKKRLWKHFCGINDCQCGGYWRANLSIR